MMRSSLRLISCSCRRPCKSSTGRARSGYILVFFAMILFGIMALAALVIDIGFARLTQRQMQTAVDAAAIEGLRGEGLVTYDDRRDAARNLTHWHFDDDLDSTNSYPSEDDGAFNSGSGQFGAGPLVTFRGGAGDPSLAASQLLEVKPENPVYKPQVIDGTPSSSGRFQVELSRGATDTSAADLYANGPSVPYLFARGSLINRQSIAAGITVRAAGAAEFRAAKSIGFSSGPGRLGLTSFALPVSAGVVDPSAPYFFAVDPAMEMPVVIGRQLPQASIPADDFTEEGYAPLFTTLTSGSTRIVGFSKASISIASGAATVVLSADQKASENASGVMCYELTGAITSTELAEIIGINQSLPGRLQAVVSR